MSTNIELNKKEYRSLLEILYLGNWVLHAHSIRDNPETAAQRKALQKFYSYYKKMNCEDCVEPYKNELYTSRDFEDNLNQYIDEYDNVSFWEEMANRLGSRDAMREVGLLGYADLDQESRIKLLMKHENLWESEFIKYGLEHIVLKDSADENP